jgi:hypothetical protein
MLFFTREKTSTYLSRVERHTSSKHIERERERERERCYFLQERKQVPLGQGWKGIPHQRTLREREREIPIATSWSRMERHASSKHIQREREREMLFFTREKTNTSLSRVERHTSSKHIERERERTSWSRVERHTHKAHREGWTRHSSKHIEREREREMLFFTREKRSTSWSRVERHTSLKHIEREREAPIATKQGKTSRK